MKNKKNKVKPTFVVYPPIKFDLIDILKELINKINNHER